MAFLNVLAQKKAEAQTLTTSDEWKPILIKAKGTVGLSNIERVSTEALFDLIDLPKVKRTPEAAKRLRRIMEELGWVATRAPSRITQRGRAGRVRGYSREAIRR